MRTLTRNEAREWLETHNIEDAMIFGVVERGFRFTFKACIEKREGIDDNDEKEFPEGCELIEYAKGSGWDATVNDLDVLPGNSLMEQLINLQGLMCGDMWFSNENVLDDFLDKALTFIIGTRDEINKTYPRLNKGDYCLLFEDGALTPEWSGSE